MAGLPGTGLSGIFYMILIIWIAGRESWMLASGSFRPDRWRRITEMSLLVAGILVAVSVQGILMRQWIDAPQLPTDLWFGPDAEFAALVIITATPFVVLALLLIGVHVTRLTLARRERRTRTICFDPAQAPCPISHKASHAVNAKRVRADGLPEA